jgi:hypothetical protein
MHPSDELPHRNTFALPVVSVTVYTQPVPYTRRRGPVGMTRYFAPAQPSAADHAPQPLADGPAAADGGPAAIPSGDGASRRRRTADRPALAGDPPMPSRRCPAQKVPILQYPRTVPVMRAGSEPMTVSARVISETAEGVGGNPCAIHCFAHTRNVYITFVDHVGNVDITRVCK